MHEAEHNFEAMGLTGAKPKVDWKKMLGYKDDVIGQNTKGIEFLFKKNKVDWIKGWATIPAAGQGAGGRAESMRPRKSSSPLALNPALCRG
jgi:dihydrolipoamide dehydrogenase